MLLACAVCRSSRGSTEVLARASAGGAEPHPPDGGSAIERELHAALRLLAQTAGQPSSPRLYAVRSGQHAVVALFLGEYGFACTTSGEPASGVVGVGFVSDLCARWDGVVSSGSFASMAAELHGFEAVLRKQMLRFSAAELHGAALLQPREASAEVEALREQVAALRLQLQREGEKSRSSSGEYHPALMQKMAELEAAKHEMQQRSSELVLELQRVRERQLQLHDHEARARSHLAEAQLSAQMSTHQAVAEAEERWAAKVRTLQVALTAAYEKDSGARAEPAATPHPAACQRPASCMKSECRSKPAGGSIHWKDGTSPPAARPLVGAADTQCASRVAALEEQFSEMHADIRASQGGIAELARAVHVAAEPAALARHSPQSSDSLKALERQVHDLRSQVGQSAADSRRQAEILAFHLSQLQEAQLQQRIFQKHSEQARLRAAKAAQPSTRPSPPPAPPSSTRFSPPPPAVPTPRTAATPSLPTSAKKRQPPPAARSPLREQPDDGGPARAGHPRAAAAAEPSASRGAARTATADTFEMRPPPPVSHKTALATHRPPRQAWAQAATEPQGAATPEANQHGGCDPGQPSGTRGIKYTPPVTPGSHALHAPVPDAARPEVRLIMDEKRTLSPHEIMQEVVKPAGVARVLTFLSVGSTEMRIACRSWAGERLGSS
ncbi:hypothetical protein AB1Y20_008311 [Prymnesium parvum]|uniref:Centrosomal protein of 44 kDa n=1 Tax=Prymnesium parvum TaxID=97485 RepID=A0AB34IU97_PRYPA